MRSIPPAIIRLAAPIAVPTMACFGLYSLDRPGGDGGAWSALAILAYPLAIMGLVGVFAVLTSPKRSKPLLWLSAASVATPIMFLLFVRG